MRYAVVERLGRGGMGVVDLGTDAEGRSVALKRVALHGSAAVMAEARRRIRREAEILASLDHPGIVPLVEVLDDGDDIVLVMPFLAGGSLSDAVTDSGRAELRPGRLDPPHLGRRCRPSVPTAPPSRTGSRSTAPTDRRSLAAPGVVSVHVDRDHR